MNLSSSTLTAPVPPSGFDVDIQYDTSKKFKPLAVYMAAIDCMYQFAQKNWDERLDGSFTIWVPGYDVEIDIESSQGIHGIHLLNSHVILGLYETIIHVSTQSKFCEVISTLSLHGRQIGTLIIQERSLRTLKMGETNSTSSLLEERSPKSSSPTYPSGDINDVDDARLSISYTYSGVRINSKDIFLAVLDALATTAQFSPGTPFRSLTANSVSGKCVISILEVDGPSQINYSHITMALRVIIVDIMVYLAKFGEMTFQLKWEAVQTAEGSIKLVDPGATA